jgi:hypothetical protein
MAIISFLIMLSPLVVVMIYHYTILPMFNKHILQIIC